MFLIETSIQSRGTAELRPMDLFAINIGTDTVKKIRAVHMIIQRSAGRNSGGAFAQVRIATTSMNLSYVGTVRTRTLDSIMIVLITT